MSRDFGRISTSIWTSQKFLALHDDAARYFYLYLHTCPHGNSIGCFRLPMGYALADLNWSPEAFRKAIDRLCEASLIAWDGGEQVVRIIDFLKHSPLTNPKHASGAVKAALALPASEQKSTICNELLEIQHVRDPGEKKALREASDRQPKAYRKPIPTETTTETDTEKDSPLPPSGEGDAPEERDEVEAGEPEPAKPKRERKKPSTSIPEEFPDSDALTAAAAYWRSKGRPELVERAGHIAEKFRAHHEARGSRFASWPAAWKTWYVNQIDFAGGPVEGKGEAAPNWPALCRAAAAKPETWDRSKFGPRPGEAGCRAPAAAQTEAGFSPAGGLPLADGAQSARSAKELGPKPSNGAEKPMAPKAGELGTRESAPSLFRRLGDAEADGPRVVAGGRS